MLRVAIRCCKCSALVTPITVRRRKGVDGEGVFGGDGDMWNVRRNGEHFPGVDRDFLFAAAEGQLALKDMRELFAGMAMFRNDAAFFQFDAGLGDVFAVNALARQQRAEDFDFDGLPILNRCHETRLAGAIAARL
jgi:hypothetical protein